MRTRSTPGISRTARLGRQYREVVARLGGLSFVLLLLDVLFGVSFLDALAELDAHTDAALDLVEAGSVMARGSQGTAAVSFRICTPSRMTGAVRIFVALARLMGAKG